MKILLIRHAKVAFDWKQSYTSEEYDIACRLYDEADIIPVDSHQETGDYERIYVSSLKRALQTAEQLFPSAPASMLVRTHLLDEVPLRSFSDTHRSHSRVVFDAIGRLQWVRGKRQEETRNETRKRADELIDLLEKNNENAILITHGFFMNVLVSRLKKRRRYEIYRSSTFLAEPLEKIKVIDRQPHCGGCHHNCLLDRAGCLIGQDKARKAGIQQKLLVRRICGTL